MKKTLISLFVASSLLYACGGGAGSDTGNAASAKKDVTQDPTYIAGLDHVSKSGCPTCHKPNEVSTGPSFKSIANKYPNIWQITNTVL